MNREDGIKRECLVTAKKWGTTEKKWGTTDFQSVDMNWHRRTGSPSYKCYATRILSCDKALVM